VVVLALVGHSRAAPPLFDPAGRGLDAFLHVAEQVAPGGTVELMAEAFGFATVTEARPLGGATLEAGWDPESLGGATPPPTVTMQTDAAGHARMLIDVPDGPPATLSLLVGIRHGAHTRTHAISVGRTTPAFIELHTADARVVPASTISAWARVSSITGAPIAGASVVVSLLEGGAPRHSQKLVTDRGGIAMARVPIPSVDEPVWQWTLRAETAKTHAGAADVVLTPREETPGMPTLEAAWDAPPAGVLAGDRVPFSIRLHDATQQPLVGHDVRYWIGPKGTTPPSDEDEWRRHGIVANTDGAGTVHGAYVMPTLVKAGGTSMQLVVGAVAIGRALSARHDVAIGIPAATAEVTPEASALVPGVEQRIHVRVRDGRGAGVAASFTASGDGLTSAFATDENGEAELRWSVPLGVGATRNVGPCASGVAAAVTLRPSEKLVPALANRREGFALCVPVDRDAAGIVRVEPSVARPGDRVRITVHDVRSTHAHRQAYSVVAASNRRPQAIASWLDRSAAGDVVLPGDAAGRDVDGLGGAAGCGALVASPRIGLPRGPEDGTAADGPPRRRSRRSRRQRGRRGSADRRSWSRLARRSLGRRRRCVRGRRREGRRARPPVAALCGDRCAFETVYCRARSRPNDGGPAPIARGAARVGGRASGERSR
jgi:hypothetical protein